jgi:hypothetical protein
MTIHIYQSYLHDSDLSELDPAFIPNDWRHNPFPEYREIGIFFDFFNSGKYKSADYVGVLSKKYFSKTKIPGRKFLEFIQQNPGYDVYFINPFPQNKYFSFNVWQHGEMCHKGLAEATQQLMDYAGVNIHLKDLGRNDQNTLLYCNYWVGNAYFWEQYISFLHKLFLCITKEMPPVERQHYFEQTRHYGSTCWLFPFIFERLFSTYLLTHVGIKYLAYKHTPEEIHQACINEYERELYICCGREVDEADEKKESTLELITKVSEPMLQDSRQHE